MPISNFRYGCYLSIAIGLINLRYHTGQLNNFQHSAFIILPGLALLGATFIGTGKKFLVTPAGKMLALIIVVASVLYAGVNK